MKMPPHAASKINSPADGAWQRAEALAVRHVEILQRREVRERVGQRAEAYAEGEVERLERSKPTDGVRQRDEAHRTVGGAAKE